MCNKVVLVLLFCCVISIDYVSCRRKRLLYGPRPRSKIESDRDVKHAFTLIRSKKVIDEVLGQNADRFTCLGRAQRRVMFSDRSLSNKFRKELKGKMALRAGKIMQRITVNLKARLEVDEMYGNSKISVTIPCVVPQVEFTFQYVMRLGRGRTRGTAVVELNDRPLSLRVVLYRNDNHSCSIARRESVPEDALDGYRAYTTYYSNGKNEQYMDTVRSIVDPWVSGGWPFMAYKAQIKNFAFRIVREAVEQTDAVISDNEILQRICPVIGGDYNSYN